MIDRALVQAIRDHQRQTGKPYHQARSEVLEARGLPSDTPTSRNAEKRMEAHIREDLGLPEKPLRWAPQPKGQRPEIVEVQAGRQHQRAAGSARLRREEAG
jgi:hypothetical protein